MIVEGLGLPYCIRGQWNSLQSADDLEQIESVKGAFFKTYKNLSH